MAEESHFGIIDIAIQLPSLYCDQDDIAKELGISPGKLKEGLGLREATVCSPYEDAVSLGLTAVKKLMDKNGIGPEKVGRLEVGSESNNDGSKSIKTYFMDLFKDNHNICGVDTVNACYGGTAAVLNAICWLESSLWDGRFAIVVCCDAGTYESKELIPLAGAAGVAILLGPNAVLKLDSVNHYFSNTFDFCKPRSNFPYPTINGKMSIEIYSKAFASLYNEPASDFMCLHTPYPRLPEKTCISAGIPIEKVLASLEWPRRIGNCYTGCVYVALSSLMANANIAENTKIILFSYGSGCASSLLRITKYKGSFNDYHIFDGQRNKINGNEFVKMNDYRKYSNTDNRKIYYPGYYIKEISDDRRVYAFYSN